MPELKAPSLVCFGAYYVVRVSFRKNNPPHMAIGTPSFGTGDFWTLFGSYEDSIEKVRVTYLESKGGSLEVIRRIEGIGPGFY